MGVIGGIVGIRLLDLASRNGTVSLFPNEPEDATAYQDRSKLRVLLGDRILEQVRGRVVLDFGCGKGEQAIELAQHGADSVIGLDINEEWLEFGRSRAALTGISHRCQFVSSWTERVDTIVSLDAFEHFADPSAILQQMDALLKPDGRIHVSFGPTWFHPLGGHLFSVFPWSHLLITEEALVRWRSRYKTDNARSIEDTGLNRITIRRFREVIAKSPFEFEYFEPVPIRKLRPLHNGLTREFTTAIVRCTLVRRRR